MINLFTPYYIDKNPARMEELDRCLMFNMLNKKIDFIYLVCETSEAFIKAQEHTEAIPILIHERPTFNNLFELVNQNTKVNDINIIANTDIFFDSTLELIDERITSKKAFALTRWDNDTPNKEYKHINRVDSQDTWIFKGKIAPVNGDFCMGVCGCDNTLAYRLHAAGYEVSNPSLSIKSYHLHNSGVRNYDVNVKTPQPYKTLQATR